MSNKWKDMYKRGSFHHFLLGAGISLWLPLLSLFPPLLELIPLKDLSVCLKLSLICQQVGLSCRKHYFICQGRGREERFKLHTWKTVTFRPCLDPWLPPLHNQSSYNENATNHHWIPSLLSGPPPPHPFPPYWKNGSDISAWEWRIEAVCNVCSLAFSFSPCSST